MIILHGDNLVASRQKLSEYTKRFDGEVIRLDGRQANLTEVKQALESASLFGQKRLVIVENFFHQPTLVDYFKMHQAGNLILWEGKTIDGRRLASFKKAQIEKYSIPATVFKFLDSLGQDSKVALYWLHQTLQHEPAELVFYLLCRRVANLIITADLGVAGLTKMAPWQKSRLAQQAKNFKKASLLVIYKKLLVIDWQQKTGQAAYNLADTLDLLVASL